MNMSGSARGKKPDIPSRGIDSKNKRPMRSVGNNGGGDINDMIGKLVSL
jgi:hypothetical protein